MRWPSISAKRLLAALLKIGWSIKRQSSSHKTLERSGYPDYVFSLMVARVAKHTGLKPEDL